MPEQEGSLATLVLESPSGPRAYRIDRDQTLIGRSPEAQIVVDHHEVSRRHALIHRTADGYAVEDLGSKNGLLHNGRRLEGRAALKDGDEIVVPGAVFRFEATDETRTSTFFAKRLPVRFDPARGELYVAGSKVTLTAKEFRAMTCLASRSGALVMRDELAAAVWPETNGVTSDESIEQLVSRLRHKLEEDPARPTRLVTRRGLGYQLRLDQP